MSVKRIQKLLTNPSKVILKELVLQLEFFPDSVLIINVTKDGPSEKAGIKPGDRIITINNQMVTGVGSTVDYVKGKLRGHKGSTVNLGIKRPGNNELLTFNIIRNTVPLPSVTCFYKVNPETGFIRLDRFSLSTPAELKAVFDTFQRNNIRNIILDLTNNPGGYLDAAIYLTEEFLPKGKLILYTKGLHTEKKEYFASKNGIFENGGLAIMINESSASASEIVAGAIQDWDRGVIVGRRSFGKGLVQRPFVFSDSSLIRLTVSRYFTPSGRLIQKPYNKGYKAYSQDLTNRLDQGELTGKETYAEHDTVKYLTMRKKRIVYGGGGIIPDIFVPMDTITRLPYLTALEKTSSIADFAMRYVDDHRKTLSAKFKDLNDFNLHFQVTDSLLYHLADFAEKNRSITYGNEDIESVRNILPYVLKATIAMDIWDESAYIEIMNPVNNCFLKALDVIHNWNMYSNIHN